MEKQKLKEKANVGALSVRNTRKNLPNCAQKQNKGITLVALIITIIVLLILAVVAIRAVQGDGIIKHAKKATNKYEAAQLSEEITLIINEINMDVTMNPNEYRGELGAFVKPVTVFDEKNLEIDDTYLDTGEYTDEDTNQTIIITCFNLEKLEFNDEFDDGSIELFIPITYKGNEFKVIEFIEYNEENDDYYVKYFELESTGTIKFASTSKTPTIEADGIKVDRVVDGVPIPVGFTHVEETTKNTGLVIEDNDGNEFVWVPVDVDPKLNITLDSDTIIKQVVITDIAGDVISEEVNDTYYSKTINLTQNTIYQVEVTYKDGTQEIKYYTANNVYDHSYLLQYHYTLLAFADYKGYTEEQVYEMTINDYNENVSDESQKITTRMELLKKFYEEEVDMTKIQDSTPEKNSVLKYGGFYIGRYEVGRNNVSKSGEIAQAPVSYADALSNAQKYTGTGSGSVTSTLPSGAAWDTIGNWILNTKARSYFDMFLDPENWAYEPSSSVTATGGDRRVANNIYDIVGNAAEWITRTMDGANVAMGSKCIGGSNAAFNTTADLSGSNDKNILGFRLLLYIN